MNPSPSRQNKYNDDSADAKWIATPNVGIRSRTAILQPVSAMKLVFDGVSLVI
ncbi:unnamed protein product, partial [Adineta steineri]